MCGLRTDMLRVSILNVSLSLSIVGPNHVRVVTSNVVQISLRDRCDGICNRRMANRNNMHRQQQSRLAHLSAGCERTRWFERESAGLNSFGFNLLVAVR